MIKIASASFLSHRFQRHSEQEKVIRIRGHEIYKEYLQTVVIKNQMTDLQGRDFERQLRHSKKTMCIFGYVRTRGHEKYVNYL